MVGVGGLVVGGWSWWVGGWWLGFVVGGWGWWLVVGSWWLVVGGWVWWLGLVVEVGGC